MSQFEFISRLRRALAGLPEEEIDRAVEYYEDYFADAGVSDEEVTEKLGEPEAIAETIREELSGKTDTAEDGVFTERGFETKKDREDFQQMDSFAQLANTQQPQREKESGGQQSGSYDSHTYQNYDDRKERKKNRKFITTLLIIFGILWLCILLFIGTMITLFSARKKYSSNVVEEVRDEVEQVLDENTVFFDKEEIIEEGDEIRPEQEIEGLKIKVGYGKVVILQGEEFSAKLKNHHKEQTVKAKVKNKIWELQEVQEEFDLKHILHNGKNEGCRLVVTIPEDFKAESIEIEVDAGTVKADVLTAKTADLEVSAGTIEIENLMVTEEAKLNLDMGKIDISDGTVNNLDLECDMGKAFYGGILTGKSSINCNMGNVEAELLDAAENYRFSIRSDMGSIHVDGEKYQGVSTSVKLGNGENEVKLSVDMGSIKVKTGKGK